MKPSTKDQVEGKLHEVKGKIKELAGKVVDNPDLEAEGTGEKIAGKVQGKIGQVEKVRRAHEGRAQLGRDRAVVRGREALSRQRRETGHDGGCRPAAARAGGHRDRARDAGDCEEDEEPRPHSGPGPYLSSSELCERAADERAGDLDLVRRPRQRRRGVERLASRRHGIGATPASATRVSVPRRAAATPTMRERPALPVHRLQVDRSRPPAAPRPRGSARPARASSCAGRPRSGSAVELRRAAARAGSCAASRRARASAAATSDGCADAQKSFAKIACSRCSPSRAWQRSPPCSRQG